MAIMVNLDVMMAKRKMSLNELAQRVDLTLANLSILKNNHAKAVRFTTLEAICKALDCQPGDILEYVEDGDDENEKTKDLNQIMSVLYLGLGYGFIYLWSSWTPEWGLTLFTAAYVTAVLGYCYGSGRKPARESWFWLTVLFAIAIPMNFYLTFGILQILALMMAAAYWTGVGRRKPPGSRKDVPFCCI